MKVCAKYNIVVLIHTGDGPYTIPTQFYPIIREFPMVNFIIGHFGIQTGGNYSFEAFWMAMDTPNVYCESGWCYQSRIVEFARELPRNKIVFGTDSPPNRPRHVAARAGNAVPRAAGWISTRTASRTTWATTSPASSASSRLRPPKDLDEAQKRLTSTYL